MHTNETLVDQQPYILVERERVFVVFKAYLCIHVKGPIILPVFNKIRIFFDRFSWKFAISNFTKIRLVGIDLIDDGRRI
jgi:hypothetical protein